ncbi:hypothetical protein ACIBQ6_12565 [Nonomuraea sp. NPDC049655]|uniref:hypothetical protein n=1 Tax=Nonomuraea sp. NPDC049655 TaxID=3364355 RepID=UPI0037B7E40E
MSSGNGCAGTPFPFMIAMPTGRTTPAATSPVTKAATPATAARAATTRRGTASRAVREPRRAATTSTTASAITSPARRFSTTRGLSSPRGPMSPVPLTVTTSPFRTAPEGLWYFSQSVWFI